jgi:hypothetical protein
LQCTSVAEDPLEARVEKKYILFSCAEKLVSTFFLMAGFKFCLVHVMIRLGKVGFVCL